MVHFYVLLPLLLADSIRVDQSKTGQGDTIFRVSTSDTENDPLTFTSSVDNPFVPLSISEGQYSNTYVLVRLKDSIKNIRLG